MRRDKAERPVFFRSVLVLFFCSQPVQSQSEPRVRKADVVIAPRRISRGMDPPRNGVVFTSQSATVQLVAAVFIMAGVGIIQ